MTPPAASSTALEPGVVLDNRYRLEQAIGDGGMGRVWSAVHVSLGHRVAIKMLHGSVVHTEEARVRFAREARVMEALGDMSRHITRVIEHGVLGDGVPYLVMELLIGEGLDACLKREKVLTLARTSEIVAQLCKALAVAHVEGVVHRDLKPANIFLCKNEDGSLFVKLLDFGVAKALAEVGEDTGKGQVLGTPQYMSPEQMQTAATIDHRADLFAVGTIAYRCATGRSAFGKGTVSEMAVRILTQEPTPPSRINPALTIDFDEFITKCLAKSPDDRHGSARELADALALVVDVMGPAASRLPSQKPADSMLPPPAPPPRPKSNALSIGLVALITLALAVGLVLFRR